MITKDQVSEMISKHFGEVENKKEFLNELFFNPNENSTTSMYGDDVIKLVRALTSEEYKEIEFDFKSFSGEHSFTMNISGYDRNYVTSIPQENVRLYFGTEEDESDTYGYQFNLDNRGLIKDVEISDFQNKISHKKLRDLFNLEFSVNQISKYFK